MTSESAIKEKTNLENDIDELENRLKNVNY